MVCSTAESIEQYISELPEQRRTAVSQLLSLIRENLPDGFDEVMARGMIVFQIPLEVSGPTCNKQPLMGVALASQKNHWVFE